MEENNNDKKTNQNKYQDNSSTGALNSIIFTLVIIFVMYLLSIIIGN